MQAAGVEVLEVTAPDKLDRRRRGTNDDFDAESSAHAEAQEAALSSLVPLCLE